jgi:hypothetical protein
MSHGLHFFDKLWDFFLRAISRHSDDQWTQVGLRAIGLYESQDMRHLCLGGLRDVTGDFLRGFMKSLQ